MSSPTSNSPTSNSYILVFGVLMLVGLLFLAWLGSPPTVKAVGQPLPELDLQPLVNVESSVDRAALEGKLVVLHFWGTWCPPCQREYPEFAELYQEFADEPDVMIVSVSSSQGPEYDLSALRDSTSEFMAKYNAPIPTYADSAAMTRSSIGLLLPGGTFGYPTTLLVDRQGTIIDAVVGSLPGDMQKLSKKINALL